MQSIRDRLLSLRDETYRDFNSRLIPTVEKDRVIGVRVPLLRALARELRDTTDRADFLEVLPHYYFEEYMLHAFFIEQISDFDECVCEIEKLLSYVDNWAVTDSLSPKIFNKSKSRLLGKIREWSLSAETYVLRFAILQLLKHFLDDDFSDELPMLVASVRSEKYYVNMMIAWYFATALAKQYDSVICYIVEGRLPVWTHNMTIKKACESFRISPQVKEYLRGLKR